MTHCLLLLALAAACGVPAPPETPATRPFPQAGPPALRPAPAAPAPDRWVAQDKLRHFGASFTAASFGYGAARFALDPGPAAVAAGIAAAAAGIAKEVVDRRAGGPFSLKDLAWDAAGIAAALALADGIQ